MPDAANGEVDLYYETAGSGETVTFIGEAGYGAWQWAWQYEALAGPYRALSWDMRGTGRSSTPPGPYDVDMLVEDLEAVLGAAKARRTHLVGVGLGGMIALRYAQTHGRARSLVLCGTAARGEGIDEQAFRSMHAPPDDRDALEDSLSVALSPSVPFDIRSQILDWRTEDDASPAAFDSQATAALSFDADPLYEITMPTLVLHGLEDPVVPADAGRELARDLPRSEFEAVAGRHLCVVEHASAVTDRLVGFLEETEADESSQ